MTTILWILGLLGIGVVGFFASLVWSWNHTPEGGKSLGDRRKELNALHSELAITDSVIRALHSVPAGLNSAPEVDDYDESFLKHVDELGGVVRIRTREMCNGDLTPQFSIETPSTVYEDFEEGPFDSAESELEHYIKGARTIAEALVDEGLERIREVTINDRDYLL